MIVAQTQIRQIKEGRKIQKDRSKKSWRIGVAGSNQSVSGIRKYSFMTQGRRRAHSWGSRSWWHHPCHLIERSCYQKGENPAIHTALLQQVIAKIEKLPAEQQDAIANRLLADLEDEQAWAKSFAATTDDQWDKLAQMVRKEIADDQIFSLDDVFPSKSWSQVLPKLFASY